MGSSLNTWVYSSLLNKKNAVLKDSFYPNIDSFFFKEHIPCCIAPDLIIRHRIITM